MVDVDQQYRTLAFLAGFGAAGALGCDWLMKGEKDFPELLREQEELPDLANENEKHHEEPTD